ncbi:MAG: filamentous hemagglutinin N-terminal domain-containing protein [Alphaproteobacteria bacterium]|nr:filamentous hemagglutinin N-terminal domain-containing protein [Alphaproteobacteria bacterium]
MRNTNFHILALRSVSILALSLLWPATSMANPEGGVVTGGNANISSAGKVLTVKQNSANAVIDWRKFDIAVDEHTRFQQPSSSATALNRVHNADPSKIMGKLTANGNVMLVNPNGVFFGADSQVDVNGLLATTADISNRDFMNGKLDFNIPGNPNAEVVNVGTITAKEAGLVGLVAPHVANHGVINARLGKVQLASGDTLSVDLYGDGLLEVAVSDAVKTQLVNNTGTINAEGGTIALTAAAGKDIVDSLIAVRGELNAPTVSQHEGKIIIAAEGSNAVINNDASQKGVRSGYSTVVAQAHLDVSGKDAGEQGGSITITADDIAVLAGSVFEASGHSAPTPTHKPSLASATLTANKSVRSEAEFLAHERRAGGSIKIGGDYLGKGTTAAAENVYVSPQSYIINNAVESGDGGRTIIWSDGTTDFRGNVTSLGGKLGGNGGFLETSGKETLVAVGYADLRADKGNKGLYLLDPADVTIYGNQASVFDNAGLVMHLGFDEGAGVNAADSSGNSNNGVLTNGGSFSSDTAPTPQANEYSVLLNNGTDYVHVNDSGTLRPTNVTLSAWVKYNSVNGTHVIIGKQEGTGNGNSYGFWY